MAYLLYTYCDHNSSALLPYIKITYQGSLSLQQEAYWSGKKGQYKKITHEHCLLSNGTLSLSSSSSSDISLNDRSFENNKNSMKTRKYDTNRTHSISM